MRKSIFIPEGIRVALYNHGTSEDSSEVCGLLAGTFEAGDMSATVDEFIPVKNVAKNPTGLFEMDPLTLFNEFNRVHTLGKSIVGCFHTHPHGYPIPSSIDINSIVDSMYWLILGHKDMTMRAYWAVHPDKYFKPADIEVT